MCISLLILDRCLGNRDTWFYISGGMFRFKENWSSLVQCLEKQNHLAVQGVPHNILFETRAIESVRKLPSRFNIDYNHASVIDIGSILRKFTPRILSSNTFRAIFNWFADLIYQPAQGMFFKLFSSLSIRQKTAENIISLSLRELIFRQVWIRWSGHK